MRPLNIIPFNNSYIQLGNDFYTLTNPTPVTQPTLIQFNQPLATQLGLNHCHLDSEIGTNIFSGNSIPKGADPLAMAYAGHQFGHFNPHLGDGRAVLLGEIISPKGIRFDIQLKGSGQTPYSRRGDGRSALGPVLREYIVSEAMATLGVPTTRALAASTTGEEVARMQLVQGGILTRVATSFIRVGTFEYFASQSNIEAIKKLADYIIERNYPQTALIKNPYSVLLSSIIKAQATLIAQWMQLGFIHGVMNTDNMSITGETIDFGPCAFMDNYSHDKVFSSIDHAKRYAYNQQPAIALWNLTRLAETFVPLLADDTQEAISIAKEALHKFMPHYEQDWLNAMRKKIGLTNIHPNDKTLIESLLNTMNDNHADFTLTFHHLSSLTDPAKQNKHIIQSLFKQPHDYHQWAKQWHQRLAKNNISPFNSATLMKSVNPVYIPRNHQIEAAIRAAEDDNDFTLFYQLNQVLQNPYQQQAGKEGYQQAPTNEQMVSRTFCGT